MALKLLVKRVDQEQAPVEHAFDEQDLITIGRDASADLTLYDEDMMVSRLHARLEREGDTYQLSDLGSRNFTLVGGERLPPGQPAPLESGDVFQVANYEVQFIRTEAVPRDFGETRFEAGFVNPFLRHAQDMMHLFATMDREYEKLPDVRKEAALTEALDQIKESLTGSAVFSRVVASGGVPQSTAAPEGMPPPEEMSAPEGMPHAPGAPSAPDVVSSAAGAVPAAPQPEDHPPPPPSNVAQPREPQSVRQPESKPVVSAQDQAPARKRPDLDLPLDDGVRVSRLLAVLVPYLSKQVKVPWQFRLEFIGHTFVPTEDSRAIYDSEASELASFLLSDRCSSEEFERRLDLVQEALDESLAHQLALLEGYREAVGAGNKVMIEQMNPQRALESVQEENVVFKYVKFAAQFRGWFVLKEKYADLEREDVSVLERRVYRPAFIRSYLETMTAQKQGAQ